MDVRDLLSVDHREVVQLARLVGRSDDACCRVAAHRRLGDALRTHVLAEECVVHAALCSARADARATLRDARLEHAHAECMIARLQPGLASERGWQDGWQTVVAALVEHIDGEEQELFPALERCFSVDERAGLAVRFLDARRAAARDGLGVSLG